MSKARLVAVLVLLGILTVCRGEALAAYVLPDRIVELQDRVGARAVRWELIIIQQMAVPLALHVPPILTVL